jgi:single-strand DNA-binding protein
MNKTIVLGNIGKDAELRHHNGYSIINFSLAQTDNWKDSNGEKKSRTTWYDCALWRKENQGTGIIDYLKKGQMVLIEGRVDARSWIDENSVTARHALKFEVKNIELVGSAKPKQEESQSNDVHTGSGHDENDLPF